MLNMHSFTYAFAILMRVGIEGHDAFFHDIKRSEIKEDRMPEVRLHVSALRERRAFY